MRGRFDVTGKLRPGKANALAVRIEKNATPGSVQAEDVRERRQERRRAGRGQPHLSRVDRLGLDSHHSRPQHRHLGRRLPDRHRRRDASKIRLSPPRLPLPDTLARRRQRRSRRLPITQPRPVSGTLRGRFGDVAFEQPVTMLRQRIEDGQARSVDASRAAPAESEAVVAGRLWRSESLRRGTGIRNRRTARLGHEGVPSRRAPVHLQRRRRRAAHLDQRPPLRRARRQLGLQRIDAALPRPRIRRRRALSPRHELHHDPQLGGPDRRRRLLRSLRPLRHRGLAGFLAGQSLGRPDPDDNAHVPEQRARSTCCAFATIPPSASTAAATKVSRRSRSTTASASILAELHPGIHYIPSSADEVVSGHGPYQPMPLELLLPHQRDHASSTAKWACPTFRHHGQPAADDARERHVAAGPRLGHARFQPRRARRAAPASASIIDKELRRRRPMPRTGSSWRSSSTTTATAPCSKRRARTAWACCSG